MIMKHALIFSEETETDVVFQCANCGAVIGFNKPDIGEPSPSLVNGEWQPPENPDQWMSPCE